jgi:predicted transcriptional regulator
MHKTNTNFSQLEKYLQKLQASDLIEKREEIYFTTEKGVGFIKAWVFLQNMLQDVEMPITIRTRIKNVNDRQLLVTA